MNFLNQNPYKYWNPIFFVIRMDHTITMVPLCLLSNKYWVIMSTCYYFGKQFLMIFRVLIDSNQLILWISKFCLQSIASLGNGFDHMKIQPNPKMGWAIQWTYKNNIWKKKQKSVKKILYRNFFKEWIFRSSCRNLKFLIVLDLSHFFDFFSTFSVKFHINAYYSEKFKYFPKPLTVQVTQWYSRITAKYQSNWTMESIVLVRAISPKL